MKVFNIPESLHNKYHGAGYGMVATVNNQVVDMKYFEDISDEFYINVDVETVSERIEEIIGDNRLGETIRYFQSLGDIHVGVFSCYEFCEL